MVEDQADELSVGIAFLPAGSKGGKHPRGQVRVRGQFQRARQVACASGPEACSVEVQCRVRSHPQIIEHRFECGVCAARRRGAGRAGPPSPALRAVVVAGAFLLARQEQESCRLVAAPFVGARGPPSPVRHLCSSARGRGVVTGVSSAYASLPEGCLLTWRGLREAEQSQRGPDHSYGAGDECG